MGDTLIKLRVIMVIPVLRGPLPIPPTGGKARRDLLRNAGAQAETHDAKHDGLDRCPSQKLQLEACCFLCSAQKGSYSIT